MMELTFCFRFVIRGNFRGAFVLWGVVRELILLIAVKSGKRIGGIKNGKNG